MSATGMDVDVDVEGDVTSTVAMATQALDASSAGAASRVTFEMLSYVKTSQLQNGLRHADYTRYRQYCTRRAHRLRVVLKLTTTRTVAKPKTIAPHMVTSELPLILLLTLCERAWAYAMHLKGQLTQDTPRKRMHLIKRLTKATKWAHALQQLCVQRADLRTQLQVDAYVHTMDATLAFERELHEDALRLFLRAKTVYDKLGEAGGADIRPLCEERAAELDDSIRFCKYMLRSQDLDYSDEARSAHADDHSVPPEEQLAVAVTQQTIAELQTRLQALAAERQERHSKFHDVLSWYERTIAVSNPKLRTLVTQVKQTEQQIAEAWSANTVESRTTLPAHYQRIVNAFADAIKIVRDDLVEVKLEAHRQNLLQLQFYCQFEKIRCTLARKLLFAHALRLKLIAQERKELAKGRKKSKPHELVLVLEQVAQLLGELNGVAQAARLPAVVQDVQRRLAIANVFRVNSVADAHMRFHKHAEALALYRHVQASVERIVAAAPSASNSAVVDLPPLFTLADMKQLGVSAEASAAAVLAAALLESNQAVLQVSEDVQKLSVVEVKKEVEIETPAPVAKASTPAPAPVVKASAPAPAPAPVVAATPAPVQIVPSQPNGPLLPRIDTFEPITVAHPDWHVVDAVPAFQTVGCKPILFDLAFNAIEFPNIGKAIAGAPAADSSASSSSPASTSSAAASSPSAASGASSLFGLGKFFGRS